MLLFHKNLRDQISKSLFDIFKLMVVGVGISGFFPQFSFITKIGIAAMVLISFTLASAVCPKDKED